MSNRLKEVWFVGDGSMFCMDVFATEQQAIDKFIEYVFREVEPWINRLSEYDQQLVRVVYGAYQRGEVTFEVLQGEYNRRAPDNAKWKVHSEEIQYPSDQRS